MKWIRSAGGPLIGVELQLSSFWMGTKPSLLDTKSSDYERGCQIKDYVGGISIYSGTAIILGDMPLETCYLSTTSGNFVVRVMYADPNLDVRSVLDRTDVSIFAKPLESFSWTIQSREIELFDSAFAGADTRKEAISFQLDPGVYRILTVQVDPDYRTSLIIHKLEKERRDPLDFACPPWADAEHVDTQE